MTMQLTDPLAELQAEHEVHRWRHSSLGLGKACDPEHCRDGRWLALCDRLAAERRKTNGTAIHRPTPEGLHCAGDGFAWPCRGALLARAEAAEHERDTATAALEAAEAWMVHILGILTPDGPLSGRVPTAECRMDGWAILDLLRAALAAPPATEGTN